MTRRLRASAHAITTTALLAGALAVAPAAIAAPNDVDTTLCPGTPVWVGGFDDADEGQLVHGLTTTKGTTPEEFQGEFVSRLDDPFGNDIFLFKLSGSRITKPDGSIDAGIWAGISGSPVYDANDNLIGSVSYSFTQIDGSDIAGVTPASNVLATEQEPEIPQPVAVPQSVRADLSALGSRSAPKLQPLTLPRVSVGTPGPTATRFAEKARGLKDRSTDFGTAGTAAGVHTMVPGGNIATSWTSGDLMFGSVGTVTAVCGDKVFAYGHPDEGVGESNQTFHSATTAQIQADGAASFKLANINPEPEGALVDDGNNGVFGVIGRSAAVSIPVTTRSTYGTKTPQSHTTVVSEPLALSSVVANQVYGESAALLGNTEGSGASNVEWTITYRREGSAEDETYTRSQFLTARSAFSSLVVDEVAGDVDALLLGSDEEISIRAVDVTSSIVSRYLQELKVAGVQFRYPGATWKTVSADSRIKITKGKKFQYRAALAPVSGSHAAARTSPTKQFTTSKGYTSKGSLLVSGSYVPPKNDFEFFFFDDGEASNEPPSFDELLADLEFATRPDEVVGVMSYTYIKDKRSRSTTATIDHVAVSGKTSRAISFVK